MQKNTRIMKAVAKATALAALMTLIFLGNVTAQTAKTATAPAVQQKGILNVAAVQNSDKTWGYELKANNKVVFKMVAAGGSTRGFATREIALSYGNVAGSRIENDAATMSNLNTTAAEKLLGFRSAAIQ